MTATARRVAVGTPSSTVTVVRSQSMVTGTCSLSTMVTVAVEGPSCRWVKLASRSSRVAVKLSSDSSSVSSVTNTVNCLVALYRCCPLTVAGLKSVRLKVTVSESWE